MKQSVLVFSTVVLLAVLLVPASATAQNAYNVNDKVISVGLGLGNVYGFYGSTTFPPIYASFETGLPIEELKNKLTLNGSVGYAGSSDEWSWGKWSYTYIWIGVGGNYHFLENNKNIDAYAGLGLGYSIVNSSYESKPGYDDYVYNYSAGGSYFAYDIHVGAKYYFTPKLGVKAELGYGFGIFRIGLAYKL